MKAISVQCSGFTLLEVLLSVAIIGIMAGISVPVYQSLQVRNDLDIGATAVTQSARRAQILAQASDGDIGWGVYIQSGFITLFKGASYATRDNVYDEVFDLPVSITPSGMSEIVYIKFTGMPQAVGTVTLTSNANETRTISINAKGTISF